jgi:hypothetical protein
MRQVANKKPATITGRDAELLSTLSKAALLDLCVEAMRSAFGHCDTECNAEEVMEWANDTLRARGDKPIKAKDAESKIGFPLLFVDFPGLNKNGTLEENDKRIAESRRREPCRIKKTVILDQYDFDVIGKTLLDDRDLWQKIGGSSSDAPALAGKAWHTIASDESLLAIWRDTSYVNVVEVKCRQGTRRPFYVNTEGFGYARYVGRASR